MTTDSSPARTRRLATAPAWVFVFGMLGVGFVRAAAFRKYPIGSAEFLGTMVNPLVLGYAFALVARLFRRIVVSKWAFWFVVALWVVEIIGKAGRPAQ